MQKLPFLLIFKAGPFFNNMVAYQTRAITEPKRAIFIVLLGYT
ncbi:hypothetical protein KKC1_23940 [Calderihabitans maritimus]|uniref:Uncharacterized protein n=1 Tax=Calderihabitans maritimus TaxID=1246530 RepID=A0A1Z5HV97_9FIRM|nr:hypothetical protein KKC1_23940 [Calderihabitans maritimus]